MPFDQFLELPGDPCWCSPEHPISKADIIVYYRDTTMLDAIVQEEQMRNTSG